MADIQKQFEKFHEEIKLKRFEENATLREKRDIIINKIKDGIKDLFDEVPTLEFIDQGSYALDLGIKPEDGDYDIDEGVIFDLYKESYEDSVIPKKWIRDIVDGHTKIPAKIKNPCVTITYSKDEEPTYHVDLPIYFKSRYDSKLYIAWGKEFSDVDNKYWEVSDPKGLNDYISDRFSGDDKKQFKRIVRYMKKWKDICFLSIGNERPPSIGITIAATHYFKPVCDYNYFTNKNSYNDLEALITFIDNFLNSFEVDYDGNILSIKLELPVEPWSNIFSKMTDKQMNKFYNKLDSLNTALKEATEDPDPYTASKTLSKHFGEDFPIPESTEARYQVNKSNAPSSNSAIG